MVTQRDRAFAVIGGMVALVAAAYAPYLFEKVTESDSYLPVEVDGRRLDFNLSYKIPNVFLSDVSTRVEMEISEAYNVSIGRYPQRNLEAEVTGDQILHGDAEWITARAYTLPSRTRQ